MNEVWNYTERPCRHRKRLETDVLFTLGNGYVGCRGFFEEEQEGVQGLGGIYMAGIYGAGSLKAWKGMHRELVNTPNFLWISLTVDGEPVRVRSGNVKRYARTLNMKDGILSRSFIWCGCGGIKVRFQFERFFSLADRHLAGQRLRITPLDGCPRIEVVAGINANITQHNLVTKIPPVQPGRRHLKPLRQDADILEARIGTLPDGALIAEGQTVDMHGPTCRIVGRAADIDGLAARRFAFTGQKGRTVEMTKMICFYTSRDGDAVKLLKKKLADDLDYDHSLAAHKRTWATVWRTADVEIDGAPDDQQALRFNLFQLIQACPRHDWRVSLGARGLTGEMHEGSVFWDNELFKMPFFTFTDPAASRSMLRFRHHTLPEARRHAADLWFRGAMYAWKSGPDGVEETEKGVGAYYAVHIVADIAYAVRQYWQATGDDEFMIRYGAEILIETARFWHSRASRDPVHGGFNILAVRGPNEYDVIVNNNCFTNMMARENIRYALDAIALLKRIATPDWRRLSARLKFKPAETAAWKRRARGLLVCYDAGRDLYVEDDMYLHRVPFDRRRGKPDSRRVVDHALPYEAMAYYQITKQSDVVTLMNLLPESFTEAQKRIAYGFYEPRTVHDSSLSYAPHAVMAARLGLRSAAYRYFRECAYCDLDDHQLNTISGLHLANLGGTWQSVIQGFAGMMQCGNRLRLKPFLPRRWKALRFRIRYKGAVLSVSMNRQTTRVTLEEPGNRPVALQLGTATRRLTRTGQTAVFQNGSLRPPTQCGRRGSRENIR